MAERIMVNSKKPASIKENLISHRRKTDFRSNSSPVNRILYLQRTIGNQAVQRLIKSGALQAKLRIGQPGDVYEQEADRVADEVMRMPEPEMQRQVDEEEEEKILQTKPLVDQITPFVQRQVEEGEEEETLQAKSREDATSEVSYGLESQINAIKGGGRPLAESERSFFEPRFGVDFSQVRVHTDAQADESARAVNAKAYTLGQDVVFGAGQYAPGTSEGRKLLAHELTHVLQQRAIPSPTRPQVVVNQTAKISDEVYIVTGGNHLFGTAETITTRHYVPTATVQTEQRKQPHSSCDPSARGLPTNFRFRIRDIFDRSGRTPTPFLCLSNINMRIQIQASWNPAPTVGTVPQNLQVSLYRAGGHQAGNRRGTRTIPIDEQQHTEEFRDQGRGTYYMTIHRSSSRHPADQTSHLRGTVHVAGF